MLADLRREQEASGSPRMWHETGSRSGAPPHYNPLLGAKVTTRKYSWQNHFMNALRFLPSDVFVFPFKQIDVDG